MCDYFRNYSINGHHVCCEYRPTKALYDHCQSDDLHLQSRSQVRLKLVYFLTCNISDNIQAYIHSWHNGRLTDALNAHAYFVDLGLDARSQWVGKGKNSALHVLRELSKQ